MNCRDFAVIFEIFTKVCRFLAIFGRDFLLSLRMRYKFTFDIHIDIDIG